MIILRQKEFGRLAGSKEQVQKRVNEFFTKTGKKLKKEAKRNEILKPYLEGLKEEGVELELTKKQKNQLISRHRQGSTPIGISLGIDKKVIAEQNKKNVEHLINSNDEKLSRISDHIDFDKFNNKRRRIKHLRNSYDSSKIHSRSLVPSERLPIRTLKKAGYLKRNPEGINKVINSRGGGI